MEKLRDKQLPQITTKQLNNIKSRLKEKKHGKSTSNLTDIIDWCNSRLEIPVDLDEVFCGGIDYELDSNEELKHLRVFISTGRLLHQMKHNSKVVATDGTYKLNYHGFPILMVGTTDYDRQ